MGCMSLTCAERADAVISAGLFAGKSGPAATASAKQQKRRRSSAIRLAVLPMLSMFPVWAAADVASTGDVTPDPATIGASDNLYIGQTGDGTLTISNGGYVSNNQSFIGKSSTATGAVTVDGTNSVWGSWDLYLGDAGSGTLNVTHGGYVGVTDYGYLGYAAGSSGTATVDGSGSYLGTTWLYVGRDGNGTLNVTNGGYVSGSGSIGADAGSVGNLTVDGSGSLWYGNVLFVGDSGQGTLNISNGAQVNVNYGADIGSFADSQGTASVNAATWTIGNGYQNLTVGGWGSGTLQISNGGQVSNGSASIAAASGSAGDVTVDGASTWTNNYDLSVGLGGSGTLTITNGGQVSSVGATLGYAPSATGNVTVDGTGSTWTSQGDLIVGNAGGGTLNINGGGQVNSFNGTIGAQSASVSVATVDGAGSAWTNYSPDFNFNDSSKLIVGDVGNGTLNITNGGQVHSYQGSVGAQFGSTGVVIVDGGGSAWRNEDLYTASRHGDLYVGDAGSGTLQVSGGGQVYDAAAYLGAQAGSTGIASVGGAGSSWVHSGDLYVGQSGNGTLTISDGGQVSNATGYIGAQSGSIGSASVASGGSWTHSGDLYVGDSGDGTLNIATGGQVRNAGGFIGSQSGSTGSVTVDGLGSRWANSGDLYVGDSGTGTLNIGNGGQVSNAGGFIGSQPGSTGSVTVDGSGSSWTNSGNLYLSTNLYLGNSGSGTLSITNGGQVSNGYAMIGSSNSATLVTVDGAGSIWNNGYLYLYNGNLDITHGGQVSSDSAMIGGYASGQSATVTVDGAGSACFSTRNLDIENGTLNITNGAQVSDVRGWVGYGAGVTGNATVDGSGSVWANSSYLVVGNAGTGTLTISNGGKVSSTGSSIIGQWRGSTGQLDVDGAGSVWTNDGDLIIGGIGAGTMTISNGAHVSSAAGYISSTAWYNGYIGDTAGITGAVVVDGAGSTWTNTGSLTIGGLNGTGTLNVTNGGQVSTSGNGIIGAVSGSAGSVTIEGIGSSWVNSGNLAVGGGGTGTLTIKGGGEVAVGGVLSANASKNIVLTGGGTLSVNQFGTGALGALDWQSGTLRLTGTDGLTVGSTGLFGPTLLLTSSQLLRVDHTLTVENGGFLLAQGVVTAGSANINAGGQLYANAGLHADSLAVAAGAQVFLAGATQQFTGLTNQGDVVFLNSTGVTGSITNSSGGAMTALSGVDVTFNGLVDGGGGYFGPGTFIFMGGFSPGASPATVSFEGGATLDAANTLIMELGGLLPGSQYDHLNVAGQLALDGTLDLRLINGFVPGIGDNFDLLDFGTLAGNFSQIRLPTLSEGTWDTSNLYSTGEVTVVPEPSILPLALGGLIMLPRRRKNPTHHHAEQDCLRPL